jgi:transposase InsO family protein
MVCPTRSAAGGSAWRRRPSTSGATDPHGPRPTASRVGRGGQGVVRRLERHARHVRVAAGVGRPGRGRLVGVGQHCGRIDGPPRPRRPEPETQAPVVDPPGQGGHADPDLIGRDFTAEQINQKWCGDLTDIPTDEGKLYLAIVEDLASRRLPGFAIGEHHDAPLAKAALCMAAAVRDGDLTGVIFHSDKGGEYTGDLFAQALEPPASAVTSSRSAAGKRAWPIWFHQCRMDSTANSAVSATSPPETQPSSLATS